MSKLYYRDLKKLFLGRKLGEGISREVYELRLDPTLVIKFESGSRSFQNINEWELWRYVEHTPLEKWFAPCVDISPCGLYLIQKKVEPIPKARLPKKVPHFFNDLKASNYGLYQNRLVCCDYGLIRFKINERMVKAEWW